jgi:putative drug exporter of the RND superfamily
VFGWLLLVVAALVVGQRLGTQNLNSYDPGQAGRAERVLAQPVVAALRSVPASAAGIQSPATSPDLVSGRSALVTFNVAGNPDNDEAVVPAMNAVAAVAAHYPALKIEEAGGASLDRATNGVTSQDFRKAEVTSVPVSLVLLLIVFGALIAAGIPLLLAGTAVISAISLLAIPSRWLPIDSTTSSIVLLVGMAVGIDYSLFYLRPTREERAAGHDTTEALRIAAGTSGRAIVVSGLTVMIALAGLFLTGIDVFSGIAVGTIMVVGVAVLGSLTFLPGILSMLGKWTDRGRIPFLGQRRTAATDSRFWGLLARAVVRRPLAWGGVATAVLLVLAVPVLSLHLEDPGIHDLPSSVPVVRALIDISDAFPGGPEPAEVVVTGSDLGGQGVSAAVAALHAQVAATHGAIREPITTAMFGKDQVLVVSVPLAGGGTDATSNAALATLRGQALPATLGQVPGISYSRPQPALGRRRLRSDGLDFPGRPPGETPRLQCLRRDHAVAAAVHVRAAVRAEHGLPRVHPEPDQGALAGRRVGQGRGDQRYRPQRGRGDQRRGDHGGGVLDLRHLVHHRVQDLRRGHGGGGAHRCDRGPRRAAAGRAGAAGRPGLGLAVTAARSVTRRGQVAGYSCIVAQTTAETGGT